MTGLPVLTREQLRLLCAELLPDAGGFEVADVTPYGVVCTASPPFLTTRLGGTVSGPALFTFADVAGFLAVSAWRGATPAAALTSSSISFLEAAEPGELRAHVDAVRVGRRSGVFSARIEDAKGVPVAVATLHFAYPGRAVPRPE